MNNRNEEGNRKSIDLDALVSELKGKDERQKKTYRRFYIMLLVFVVIYALLLVVNPDPELTLYHRLAGLCYVTAFLIGAWLFRREHRMVGRVDYTDQVLKVLKSALERYRPFPLRSLPYLLVLIFIDLGISLGGPLRYMPEAWSLTKKMLILQAVYWGI
ncbi:MAG TPA: hypothetical protein PLW67_13095, partial [Prolixibacteraceae bacterium]|nr:hypothetical protein [Prolixibacteraceae bacterium]